MMMPDVQLTHVRVMSEMLARDCFSVAYDKPIRPRLSCVLHLV